MGVTGQHTLCPCGGYYLIKDMHEQTPRHREWLTGQPEIPVPAQPAPKAYEEMPDRIVFGETVVCPLCRGRLPLVKKGVKPDPKKMFTRDKRHPQEPCPRCDGKGVVPRVGV